MTVGTPHPPPRLGPRRKNLGRIGTDLHVIVRTPPGTHSFHTGASFALPDGVPHFRDRAVTGPTPGGAGCRPEKPVEYPSGRVLGSAACVPHRMWRISRRP